ncbi:glutaredoxin family protein [Salinibacillus xinjiangensis]|uniref:Glutaredoxin family protein n=1 Tax=Salinibacillus xinjiangensis TaxID=1229268 RepID=A0A6G1X8U6_9BACI|nr:glutaredoxin [Salinibacillus xinjiangensis]MRG87228.1 glutaredoxin family protein [Salinibacillus xinjiangensis]
MNQEEIIVYTSQNCNQSKKVMNLLENWNKHYEERNISEDRSYLKELQQNGIYATPATFIEDKCILGYQRRAIVQAIS